MPRLPIAARTLIDELGGLYKNLDVAPHGEPDGFRTYRSIEIGNQNAAAKVRKALEHLPDERVAGLESSGKKLIVRFVDDQRSEIGTPFEIEDKATLAAE